MTRKQTKPPMPLETAKDYLERCSREKGYAGTCYWFMGSTLLAKSTCHTVEICESERNSQTRFEGISAMEILIHCGVITKQNRH